MSEVLTNKSQHLNAMLLRIERHQQSIYKYLEKLNSYTCEPTDYNCFIAVRRLKDNLTELAFKQKDILKAFRRKTNLSHDDINVIESCEKKYQQVEADMAAYILQTNSHF